MVCNSNGGIVGVNSLGKFFHHQVLQISVVVRAGGGGYDVTQLSKIPKVLWVFKPTIF